MGSEMSKLFEAPEINSMKQANRFIRLATWDGRAAEDGACTHRLTGFMAQPGEDGMGLIITSNALQNIEKRLICLTGCDSTSKPTPSSVFLFSEISKTHQYWSL